MEEIDIEPFSYDLKELISLPMKNYFTLTQDIDFKGFEVKRGKKAVLEKNPNAYSRSKLNHFAEQLGLRERQLKSQIKNLKLNYQLSYDDVPAELPRHVDLDKIESKLQEVVECSSIIGILRKEHNLVKVMISKLKKDYKKLSIEDGLYVVNRDDYTGENWGKFYSTEKFDILEQNTIKWITQAQFNELRGLKDKASSLKKELYKITEEEISIKPFSSKVAIYNLKEKNAHLYIRASILSKLSAQAQLDYFSATSLFMINRVLAESYKKLALGALDGDVGDEHTIPVEYLTGIAKDSLKNTKTAAKIIISKKDIESRILNSLSRVEKYEVIYAMVEEKVIEIYNDMQKEIAREKNIYENEKSKAIYKFENDKRLKIEELTAQIAEITQKFEHLERERELNHINNLSQLEQDFQKLRAIVPIADFTDKVLNALV